MTQETVISRRKMGVMVCAFASAGLGTKSFASSPVGRQRASGVFTTGSTAGSVALYQDNDTWTLVFGGDFKHDGSPDPWVAFGTDGFRQETIIGELTQFEGHQILPIGPKLDPTEFNEVYIWCLEHRTSLGRAKLVWP